MKIEQVITGPVAENPTNVWLLENEATKEVVIVDPGDDAEQIASLIAQRGLTPAGILLTHGHFDHILAVEPLRKKYNIPVYAGEHEKVLLEDAQLHASALYPTEPVSIHPDLFLHDGELITLGNLPILTIWTPGHTSGSVCYYVKDSNALFSGDTIFAGRHGRIDLVTSVPEAMMDSVLNKLMVLPAETVVYPGHRAITTIEAERKVHGTPSQIKK